jgi:hypothetical protein
MTVQSIRLAFKTLTAEEQALCLKQLKNEHAYSAAYAGLDVDANSETERANKAEGNVARLHRLLFEARNLLASAVIYLPHQSAVQEHTVAFLRKNVIKDN